MTKPIAMMTPKTPSKILVVDDEPEMPEAFKSALGSDYLITGVTSGEEAIAAANRELFPIVILDLRMEGLSGIEVLKRLKEICPYQQVIIFTGHASMETAIEAINLGAFKYLMKPFFSDHLRRLVSEAFVRFEQEANMNANFPVTTEHLRSLGLSGRETDVAIGILEGKTNLEIAESLSISPRTVEKHVENILSHFEISTRNKLAARLREFRKPPQVVPDKGK